jgi:hypothetical protein
MVAAMTLRVLSLTYWFAIAATAGCGPTPKEEVARCVEAVRWPINEAAKNIDGWIFEPLTLTEWQRKQYPRHLEMILNGRFRHRETGEQLELRILAGHRNQVIRFPAWTSCFAQASTGFSFGQREQLPLGMSGNWRFWAAVTGLPSDGTSYIKERRAWGKNLGWNWADPALRTKDEARPLVGFAVEVVAPVEPQYSYADSQWRSWEMQWDRAEFSERQLDLIETLLERIETPLAETFAVKDTFVYE